MFLDGAFLVCNVEIEFCGERRQTLEIALWQLKGFLEKVCELVVH